MNTGQIQLLDQNLFLQIFKEEGKKNLFFLFSDDFVENSGNHEGPVNKKIRLGCYRLGQKVGMEEDWIEIKIYWDG